MKKKIFALIKEPIIVGSIWLTVGGFIANIGNYFFNLLMGRMLSLEQYGTFVFLVYLSFIISLPSSIILMIVTKFVADFFAKKEEQKINRLAIKISLYSILLGIGVIFLSIFFKQFLSEFFNITDDNLFIITSFIVALSFIVAVNQGILSGVLRFRLIAILGILTIMIKLFFSWFLIKLGWLIPGALIAIFLSSIFNWVAAFWSIRKYFTKTVNRSFGLRKKFLAFSFPTLITSTTTTLFLSSDLILVKHYFSPQDAGFYAATSIMGKSIYFALSPIITVFFPLVVQKISTDREWIKELILSIFMLLIPGLIVLFIYFFEPNLIRGIFFPAPEYSSIVNLIGLYGIYMLIFAFISLFLNLFLALEKQFLINLGLLITFLQIFFIINFHETLKQIIFILIITASFLLIVFVISIPLIVLRRKDSFLNLKEYIKV